MFKIVIIMIDNSCLSKCLLSGGNMNNPSNDEWLSIDKVTNALDSLETAAYLIDRKETAKWKWIGIAIHHSLYSFCVSALELGNPDHVLIHGQEEDKNYFIKKGNDIQWKKSLIIKQGNGPGYLIEWEYTKEEPPQIIESVKIKQKKEKLIGFWTALARVQDQEFWMGRQCHIKAVSLTNNEWQSITWLNNQVRNKLIHFIPTSLSIHIGDIKCASLDAIRIIEFLCFESNAVNTIHVNWKKRVRIAAQKIRSRIQE